MSKKKNGETKKYILNNTYIVKVCGQLLQNTYILISEPTMDLYSLNYTNKISCITSKTCSVYDQ